MSFPSLLYDVYHFISVTVHEKLLVALTSSDFSTAFLTDPTQAFVFGLPCTLKKRRKFAMSSFEMANLSSSVDRFLIAPPSTSDTSTDLPTVVDIFVRQRTALSRFVGEHLRHAQNHLDLALLKFAARLYHDKMKQLLVFGPVVCPSSLWSDWETTLESGFGATDLLSDADQRNWTEGVNPTFLDEIRRLRADECQYSSADIVRTIKGLQETYNANVDVLATDKSKQRSFLVALRSLMKRSDYVFAVAHIPHELLRQFFTCCIYAAGNVSSDAMEAFEDQSYEQQFQLPLLNIKERFAKLKDLLSDKLVKSVEKKVTATAGKRWYTDLADYHKAIVAFSAAKTAATSQGDSVAETALLDDDDMSVGDDDDDEANAAVENEGLLNIFNVLPLPHPLLPCSSINRRRTAAVESLSRDHLALRAFLLEYTGVLDASFEGPPGTLQVIAGIPLSHMKKLLKLLHHVPSNGGASLPFSDRLSIVFDVMRRALTFQLLGQRVALATEAYKKEIRLKANKDRSDAQQCCPQLETNWELLRKSWDVVEYALQVIRVEQEHHAASEERNASHTLVRQRVLALVSSVVEIIDFQIALGGSQLSDEQLVTCKTMRAVWQCAVSHVAGDDDKARRVIVDEGVCALLVEVIPIVGDDLTRLWLIQCCRSAVGRVCRGSTSHCSATMEAVRHAMTSTLRSTTLPSVVRSALQGMWIELEECYGAASTGLFAINFEPRAEGTNAQSKGIKRERDW